MATTIDPLDIRWVQDGEPHKAEVYNRPIEDVIAEANLALTEIDQKVTAAGSGGIVFAIALG